MINRRLPMTRTRLYPHPECGDCRLDEHSLPQSIVPQSWPSPSIAVHGSTSSAVNSEHCGCRSIDCSLRLHCAFPRHRSCVTVSVRFISPPVTNYLCQLHSASSPTPPLRSGVGALHFTANPQPPFAFPARQCRCTALLPQVGAGRQSPRSSHP